MDQDLLRQAQALGIETSYIDVEGVERIAEETSLRLLIEILDRPRRAAPALVVRQGDAIDLEPADGLSRPTLTTLCKHDHVLARSTEPQLTLPDDLPRGSYRLDLALDSGEHRTLQLLHTPARAYQPEFALEGKRSWVLGVQLYSLCNERNFGHGDFTDLRQLLELVADVGGGGVGVNPLHALAEDDPEEASPYAPSTRRFLNWLYIDVGSLTGVEPAEIEALRPRRSDQNGLVDYEGVARAKEQILRLAWARFTRAATDAEREAFAAFQDEMGEDLRRYAAFCLLRRREGGAWRYWRRPWAHPSPQDIDALQREAPDEIGFHQFVQFHAHRQLAQCAEAASRRAMAVGLYLDVAVGVHPDGFDAWDDPDAFLQGVTIGAPPDALNRVGQNWGLTSFHPLVLRERAYRPFRQMLGAAMRYAGAIRIDHVLGLNRLYVVPPQAQPREGLYLRFPLEDLLAVTAMESQFHRCVVIGEDLGTVPEGLRGSLRDHGIWTYRVVMFEQDANGFLPPDAYPEAALATFSTHDLPTFAGWVDGKDIELMRSLGLPVAENGEQRRAARERLRRALSAAGIETIGDVAYDAVVQFLFKTKSRLLAFALEDLIGSAQQVNMPGTYREYPNWRHGLALDLSDVAALLQRHFGRYDR